MNNIDNTPNTNGTLTTHLRRLLRPIVKILIKYGFSHAQLTLLLKDVYVEVADAEYRLPNRKHTDSRIAVLTGLNRKEVKAIRAALQNGESPLSHRPNRASRVVLGWQSDRRYHDAQGNTAPLSLYGDSVSFETLVKDYSGDMPMRAVLDELLRVGAVKRENDHIALLDTGYTLAAEEAQMIAHYSTTATDLLDTLNHNLGTPDNPRLQSALIYDEVCEEGVYLLRALSHEKILELLQQLDKQLSLYQKGGERAQGAKHYRRVGLGVYYIERDT